MFSQIPPRTACPASSGHDHFDSGNPQSLGGGQANALTCATCGAVNTAGRPQRFASPNEDTPGAAHQRCRHVRAVSWQMSSDAAIRAFGNPSAASSTIWPARPGVARCVRRGQAVQVPALCVGQHDAVGAGHRHRGHPRTWVPSVPSASSVTWLVVVSDTPIGHDHTHGRPTRVDENIPATAVVRPHTGTLAGTGRHRHQVPGRVRLRHRPPERRRHPTTDAAAVRRISRPVGLRDLPRQQ
jgi:hypothetical protein